VPPEAKAIRLREAKPAKGADKRLVAQIFRLVMIAGKFESEH
jgi:hypothetical protein